MRHLSFFLLLLLAACSPKTTTEPWAGPTTESGPTEDISIPSLGVALKVPAGTDTVFVGGGATFYTRPDSRSPRSFSIGDGQPALVHTEPATTRQEKKLPGGNLIRYELRTADEGSGGAEEFLDGALAIGDRALAVHCHDQAEAPATPTATWCLEWLATVHDAR